MSRAAQMSDKIPRVLPRDMPDYHARAAAHLRALAETTTTEALKTRLLRDAEEHERQSRPESEPVAEERP